MSWTKMTALTFVILTYVTCIGAAVKDGNGTEFFRNDYTFKQDINAFYKEHTIAQRWSDALVTCKAEGAELFVPLNSDEVDYVLKLSNASDLWIAATDVYSEGDFLTIDGTPLSELYLNWSPGEPNNVNNNENCVIMNRAGAYVDIPCDHFKKFICKRKNSNVTWNDECQTHDPGYSRYNKTDRCYKFHSTPINWHQAFKVCKAEESQMVIINSEDEAALMMKFFAEHPVVSLKGNFEKNIMHIGFSELLSPGFYVTIEGQYLNDAGYDNWAPGQPDNYQGKEHCGSMFRDGNLNDFNCESRAMFVCEKNLLNIDTRINN